MRSADLLVSVGITVALLTPSVAQADIAPLPKPKSVTPQAKPGSATPQPAAKKPVQPTVRKQAPVSQQPTVQQPPVTPAHTSAASPRGGTAPALVIASGGRARPSLRTTRQKPITSLPGQIADLFPTRLSEVGQESLPSYATWPSWVLGVFAFLASAEAFLLVRLVRARRFRHETLQELPEL
jgi:hypothetical protein